MTPKEIIADALDDFDTEDFVDQDFSAIAADKILADLEFRNFKIVQLVPKERQSLAIENDAGPVTNGEH